MTSALVAKLRVLLVRDQLDSEEGRRRSRADGDPWWQVSRNAHDHYRTSLERFRERFGVAPAPSMPLSRPSPRRDAPSRVPKAAFGPEARCRVPAHEHLWFASLLKIMGECRTAQARQPRAMAARTADFEVVRHALNELSLSGIRRSITAALRMVLDRSFHTDTLSPQGHVE